jgi:hypothetical protein
MNDSLSFQNMDSWNGGSSSKFGLNFKQIVLMHINRCVVNGSVEWHGGYWQEKIQANWTDRHYVQNSRDVYNNSIKMLRALLLGYYDKQMKEADTKLQEEWATKYNQFKEKEKVAKDILNDYYSFKVDWHIRMFEQLIMLSKRLNFFEEESSDDEL